jgi:hypothetical protein
VQAAAKSNEVLRPLQIALPAPEAGIVRLVEVALELRGKIRISSIEQPRVRNHWPMLR